jgi:hypothetical protein
LYSPYIENSGRDGILRELVGRKWIVYCLLSTVVGCKPRGERGALTPNIATYVPLVFRIMERVLNVIFAKKEFNSIYFTSKTGIFT